VVDGIDGTLTSVHICRGNWSRDDGVLLSGGYEDLMPWLRRMNVGMFALEYATPRAGNIEAVAALKGKALGLGAVNPRTAETEDPRSIAERARKAADILGEDRILLNPDCGFGTFADRPVSSAEIAFEKLRALSKAAALLR
jgi:5-methyltetrahydropteroyltriglutamate--homocysteine methyltransferase